MYTFQFSQTLSTMVAFTQEKKMADWLWYVNIVSIIANSTEPHQLTDNT